MDEDTPQKPPTKINDPSVVLFLGLYLILLAFYLNVQNINLVFD